MRRVFRSQFDGRELARSVATGISFEHDPGKTVQSGAEDADINVILRRFGRGAPLPGSRVPPTFGDFSGVTDYQSALEQLRESQALFMGLPASVRGRFKNDPAQLMEFLEDPANRLEAAELGLLDPAVARAVRKEAADAKAAVSEAAFQAETAKRAKAAPAAPPSSP